MTRDSIIGTVPRVSHIVHLGHASLPPSLSAESIHALVLDELEHTLAVLGDLGVHQGPNWNGTGTLADGGWPPHDWFLVLLLDI